MKIFIRRWLRYLIEYCFIREELKACVLSAFKTEQKSSEAMSIDWIWRPYICPRTGIELRFVKSQKIISCRYNVYTAQLLYVLV